MTHQVTHERASLRSRCLLRSLHSRIFVACDGRIYLSSGKPDFERLRECLSRTRTVPNIRESPTLDQLGLGCDGELTPNTIHAMQRALTGWSSDLAMISSRRRLSRGDRAELGRESCEIERLQKRLAACQQSAMDMLEGERKPTGLPYVLDEPSECELQRIVGQHFGRTPPLLITNWQSRLVYWIAGANAVGRFLQAIKPLLVDAEGESSIRQLESFARQLPIWRKRSYLEPQRFLHRELTRKLDTLPKELVSDGSLTGRLKARTIAEHCELLSAKCTALLRTVRERQTIEMPATAAAIVCGDGGVAPLPVGLLPRLPTRQNVCVLNKRVVWLMRETKHPGYDRLLQALNQLKNPPAEHLYRSLRGVLLKGVTLDDLIWTIERGVLPEMAASPFRPATVRHMVMRLERIGMVGSHRDLEPLLGSLFSQKEWVDQWLVWLGKVERGCLGSAAIRRLRSAFLHSFLPAAKHAWNHEPLQRWLAAIHERPSVATDALSSPQVGCILNQIGSYQRLAGQQPSVPKAIEKELLRVDNEQREYAYLRRIVHDGGPALRKRVERLSCSQQAPRLNVKRLARTAAESFVGTACASLEQMVRERGLAIWDQLTGAAFPQSQMSRLEKYLEWLGAMDTGERRLLALILKTWRQHGDGFKQQLPANRRWLTRAKRCGLDLRTWMEPYVLLGEIGSRAVRVQAMVNPWEVFAMGTLFGTCLSLGSFNQMSLLANAHDVNKQVVFLTTVDERGGRKVLGRQLIAISGEFKLLGYHCYVSLDHKLKEQRTECLELMSSYCGELAARCGIELADKGEPDRIGKHFWYDDGTWAWNSSAPKAWERAAQSLKPSPADNQEVDREIKELLLA